MSFFLSIWVIQLNLFFLCFGNIIGVLLVSQCYCNNLIAPSSHLLEVKNIFHLFREMQTFVCTLETLYGQEHSWVMTSDHTFPKQFWCPEVVWVSSANGQSPLQVCLPSDWTSDHNKVNIFLVELNLDFIEWTAI